MESSNGVLAGLRFIEIAGIGPGPFAAMMLADHGAEVIRVERPGAKPDPTDILTRSRVRVEADLKSDSGVATVVELAREADGLIEGFRPGVMERLGLGPDVLLSVNPKLIYGRMTGWGQDGPLAEKAGHDINYIAVSGVLNALGRAGAPPTPPINLVGDFGGGGMMLAFAMAAGVLGVRNGAPGQVIDCAMTDGASLLMSMMWGFRAKGIWQDQRGENYLDTGAPYYDVYPTSDGGYISIGSIESKFYASLLDSLGLTDDLLFQDQNNPSTRALQRERLTEIFLSRSRDEWTSHFKESDACFAPVMTFKDAPSHPHNAARDAFLEVDGVVQPAPAPRFSKTPAGPPRSPAHSPDHKVGA